MIPAFSRRQFILMTMALPWVYKAAVRADQGNGQATPYPKTNRVLRNAYFAETIANQHYVAYAARAIDEKFPNIAYLFQAFAMSESIHASNCKRVLAELGQQVPIINVSLTVKGTRANLRRAAGKEVEKINTVYPSFLKELETEAYPNAIAVCMYSWHSHKQHEAKIREIQKYAGVFFGTVAEEIEDLKLDFHVCDVCGSTIDAPPVALCAICNQPMTCYSKVVRPG